MVTCTRRFENTEAMDLILGTLVLRPYVFAFVAAFVVVSARDVGIRRTLVFMAWVGPLTWLAEFSSTRTGVPFGLYRYTGATRGVELYLADVPLMDPLSFTFLAYAAFALARVALAGRRVSAPALALASGVAMMLLDVVADPAAVRGDRWFLGQIFEYPDGGVYFGVPLSNFVGWVVVGTAGVGGHLWWSGDHPVSDPWPGVGLYYAVLLFNLAVTAWIGEWVLLAAGLAVHAAFAIGVFSLRRRASVARGVDVREVQRA
jgi:putative membrane protein